MMVMIVISSFKQKDLQRTNVQHVMRIQGRYRSQKAIHLTGKPDQDQFLFLPAILSDIIRLKQILFPDHRVTSEKTGSYISCSRLNNKTLS